jgi:hypothetical protein
LNCGTCVWEKEGERGVKETCAMWAAQQWVP